ncbi:hypothetical protein [Goodfellowiella coeruleoviolacea]|uniref:Uncharacterized protein n=1 Tax=Goodfellowiella coeruleoviolacea TaxID=334858 RepID=A0AAE3GJ00_9PSEU|nr:hypothetical protein [Goodfellowiella coeruleoviolacea]MCP2169045.1 hypothetical protein [Goodfellowiella coeruleoviolacea]
MTRRAASGRGAHRALRAGLLAVSSAALTVTAHGLAGGALPEVGLPVLFTVALAGAGTAVADRRQGLIGIAATLGASQVGQHVLLSLLGHDHPAEPPVTASPTTASPGTGTDVPGLTASSGWMTLAHVLAALLTALLLARAETAVFAIAAALALLLPRRLCPPPAWAPLRLSAIPAIRAGSGSALDVLLRRAHRRRGPPVRRMATTRTHPSYPQPPELSTGSTHVLLPAGCGG